MGYLNIAFGIYLIIISMINTCSDILSKLLLKAIPVLIGLWLLVLGATELGIIVFNK